VGGVDRVAGSGLVDEPRDPVLGDGATEELAVGLQCPTLGADPVALRCTQGRFPCSVRTTMRARPSTRRDERVTPSTVSRSTGTGSVGSLTSSSVTVVVPPHPSPSRMSELTRSPAKGMLTYALDVAGEALSRR
jgi:hypothetical protein